MRTKPQRTIPHQLCPSKRPPPGWALSALCLDEEKKRHVYIPVKFPKATFPASGLWTGGKRGRGPGTPRASLQFPHMMVSDLWFHIHERQMIFHWQKLSKKLAKSKAAQKELEDFYSLFIIPNIFTHVLCLDSVISRNLSADVLYCGFLCATWWKYQCWSRDILVAPGSKSSPFVPGHSSPLFPLISFHLAVICCSYLVCHYETGFFFLFLAESLFYLCGEVLFFWGGSPLILH